MAKIVIFGSCRHCLGFVPTERWPRGLATIAVDEAPEGADFGPPPKGTRPCECKIPDVHVVYD